MSERPGASSASEERRRALVVASECCSALFPQNTIVGFRYGLESGVDGIEFDVHLSRDGNVVVQHDYRLNGRITRRRDGTWLETAGPAICQLTLDEIKRFDVGRYQPDSIEEKTHPRYQPSAQPIPTLAEFLAEYDAQASRPMLWIELKTSPFQRNISSDPRGLVERVLATVDATGLIERVVLLAFEWNVLQMAAAACPGILTDYLTLNSQAIVALNARHGTVDPTRLFGALQPSRFSGSLPRAIHAAGGAWWGPYVADVSRDDVAFAHDLGIEVNVWGVESTREGIDAALALNADAITLADSDLLMSRFDRRAGQGAA